MTRYLLPVAAAVLGAGTLLGPGGARAAGCDVPLEAATRLNDTPFHMVMTTTGASGASRPPEVAELISTDDATYVRVGGAWQPGPREELTLWDLDVMGEAGDYLTCALIGSEEIAGTQTDVWRIDDQSDPDEAKRQTVWIARDAAQGGGQDAGRAAGRIVRMEVEIRNGNSAGMRTSAEIDYENVLPPR